MTTLDSKKNSIFKFNKKLLNKAPANHSLTGPTGPIYTAEDKAELFVDIIQTQFFPNLGLDMPEVNSSVQTIHQSSIPSSLFVFTGILAKIIKRLTNCKALGNNNIPNAALKNLPPKGVVLLTNILYGCFRLGYFPSVWKTGIIITIPKAGKDHNLLVNHKPIILLFSVAKLFERIIQKFLLDTIGAKFRHEQFAFRTHHSTSLQLVNVIDHICAKANNRKNGGSII